MSDNASAAYIASSDQPYAVIVPTPVTRTRDGGPHAGSANARKREARRMRPDLANYGIREVRYGTSESKDTVVIFDPTFTPAAGL